MIGKKTKILLISLPFCGAGWTATWALLEPIGGLTTLFSNKWLFVIAFLFVLCVWGLAEYHIKRKGKIPYPANGKILYIKEIGLGVRAFMIGVLAQLTLPILFGGTLDKNQIVLDDKILAFFQKENANPEDYKSLLLALEKEQNMEIDTSLQTEFAEIIKEMYEDLDSTSRIEINKRFFEGDVERRMDLAISSFVAGTNLLTVVKLFPKQDSITTKDILIFENQMREIKATKGIIITKGEYSTKVLDQNNQYQIDICSFKDAKNRDWKNDIKIPVILKTISIRFSLNMTINTHNTGDVTLYDEMSKLLLSTDNGKSSTPLIELFIYKWNKGDLKYSKNKNNFLDFSGKEFKIQTVDKKWVKISDLKFPYKLFETEWFAYLEPKEYKELRNHSSGQVISDITIEIPDEINPRIWSKLPTPNLVRLEHAQYLEVVKYPKLEKENTETEFIDLKKMETGEKLRIKPEKKK